MRMYKQVLCVWLLITGSCTLISQPLEPWINGQLPPVKGKYEWRVASGDGRIGATRDFIHFLNSSLGCQVNSETETIMFMDQANPEREQKDEFTQRSNIKCSGGTVWYIRAREVYDEKTRRTYQLYQYSTFDAFKPDKLEYRLVNDYDKTKTNMLSFVPFGVAQFHKGDRKWGNFFLASEAIGLLSTGLTWYISSNYYDDYQKERDVKQRSEYKRLAQSWETLCYVSAGATGALYLSGVLHGLFADGKKKKYDLIIASYLTPKNNGVLLSLKF